MNWIKPVLNQTKNYIATPMAFFSTAAPAAFIEGALNYPVWQLFMDYPLLGLLMTVMLAILYTFSVKIVGACFAKGDYKVGASALCGVVMIIALAFFAQREVAIDGFQDPFAQVMSNPGTHEEPAETMKHFIATGILSALTLISITISYLYHLEKFRLKPIEEKLANVAQNEALDHELQSKRLEHERLKKKPDEEAQNRVNEKMLQLKEKISANKRIIEESLDEIGWIMANIENAKERFELAIINEYQKSK